MDGTSFLSKRCPYLGCKQVFERSQLSEHVFQVHRNIKCPLCSKIVKHKSWYRHKQRCGSNNHLNKPKIPSKRFKCIFDDCPQSFVSDEERSSHLQDDHRVETSGGRVLCPYENCDKVLKNYSLKLHIESVHEKIRAQCHKCGRELLKTSLPHHLQICQNESESTIRCKDENCHKTFKSKHYMSIHWKNMHGWGPKKQSKKLQENGKSSASANFLLVHSQLKVTCDNCKKQIVQKHLQRHLRTCILVREDKFLCTVPGCDKYFNNIKCRRNHLYKVHLPLVPCPRQDCDVVIKPASLPRHIRHVHENFRVTCSNCDKEMTFYHLNKHLKLCLKKNGQRTSGTGDESTESGNDSDNSESESGSDSSRSSTTSNSSDSESTEDSETTESD